MSRLYVIAFSGLLLLPFSRVWAEDDTARVRKAVQRSTLDQAGNAPFHLKAVLAPTRDQSSNRRGEVEIWWESPTRFRREVRSPDFHQVEIIDGNSRWQKSEGDYFPEWLREIAVAIIRPIPFLDATLQRVSEADVKRIRGTTYYQWSEVSSDGTVQKGMGGTVALTDDTGLIFYGGGLGWGGMYHDYKKFHQLMIGHAVAHGSPEVDAKITTLEDLKDAPAGLFDVHAPGADLHPLQTVMVNEVSLRKNLQAAQSIAWPSVKDGPVEGTLTTTIVLDRDGVVREVGTIVSDNQAVNDAAAKAIAQMRFSPYTVDSEPVQVLSRITMAFRCAESERKK